MTFIMNAWTNINKLDRNEPGAAEVTTRLQAGRSSSFHCFQLFLEENVMKKPQERTLSQQSDKNTTENNPRSPSWQSVAMLCEM